MGACSAQADELQELPIGTFEFPPYNYTENGMVTGAGTEIFTEVLRRMGYRAKITRYPWKRTQAMAERGEIAGMFTFTSNPQRAAVNHITEPLGVIYDVFFKRRADAIHWEKIDDLKGHIIGATDGYNYAPVFLNPLKSGELKVDLIASQHPELVHLKKLAAGHIDLAICEISLCGHIIRKSTPQFDAIDYIDHKIGPIRTFHAGFSKKWPGSKELHARFNEELGQFAREGGRKKIHQKYHLTEID
ncbi:MAG: transporter substrate-binding domain-containing protein [Magnetococcales bacterium]|nr:transporter substrate-binding domain-containing protein [Magnetococcales bacterium]